MPLDTQGLLDTLLSDEAKDRLATVKRRVDPSQLNRSAGAVGNLNAVGKGERPIDGCPLTARELEVVAAIADGLTDHDAAVRLCLSEHTIKQHLKNAYDQLPEVPRNRTGIAVHAVRKGWIA